MKGKFNKAHYKNNERRSNDDSETDFLALVEFLAYINFCNLKTTRNEY